MTLKEFFESPQLLAINLKTKEQADIFSKEADKLGKKWCDEDSYLKYNLWDMDKEETCYDNEGRSADIFYYNSLKKYKVLNFEDIEWEELKMDNFTKKDIKNGAVVELRNGERYLKVDNTLLVLFNNILKEDHTSYMLLNYYNDNLTYKSDSNSDSNYDIMKVLNPDTNLFIGNYNAASALLTLNYLDFSWTWERKEKKKIKLKDLTCEQYKNWKNKQCRSSNCKNCIFYTVSCGEWRNDCWVNNKDLYNEKFLNQEVELGEIDNA